MSENVRKLVGVVAMAVLVVVGVAVSSGDDTDFTRNRSFSSAAETFAGADRLEDPDCCDQNAYEISLLQAKYEELENEIALLKGNYEAFVPMVPGLQQMVDLMSAACDSKSLKIDQAMCVADYLIGLELELARQVVLAHGNFGFFHRYEGSSKGPNTIQNAPISEEACQPISYGYGPPPRYAISADTLDGNIAHPETVGSLVEPISWADTPTGMTASHHKWELWIQDKGLCN